MITSVSMGRTREGKKIKLKAYYSFPTMFSKAFVCMMVKTWDYLVIDIGQR